jgi:hypothetical protein
MTRERELLMKYCYDLEGKISDLRVVNSKRTEEVNALDSVLGQFVSGMP